VLATSDRLRKAAKSDRPASLSTMISPSMMALSASSHFDAAARSRYFAVQSKPRRMKMRVPLSSMIICDR
jgi:hypothetical protein